MKSYTYRSPELEVYITVEADDECEAGFLLEERIQFAQEMAISLPHFWSYQLYSVNDLL